MKSNHKLTIISNLLILILFVVLVNIQSTVEAFTGCSGCTVIFSDTRKLIKVVVGEVDPDLQGNEVFAAGFSGKVNMVYKSNGVWLNEVIYVCKPKEPACLSAILVDYPQNR